MVISPPMIYRKMPMAGIVALVFLASAVVGLVIAFPLAGAFMCPRCFGFDALAQHVFVEQDMPADRRARIQATIDEARDTVHAFYGNLRREAHVFVCDSDACYRRFGGGRSRGMAVFDRALILAPDGATRVIAAHELAHIELHARAGAWRVWSGAIPRWFDEGLAVNISNDLRYLVPGHGTARCRARTSDPLPESRRDWLAHADEGLYAAAACRVSEWLAANGGAAGVRRLTERIARGEPFAASSLP
jgi:hypothetical protein